ncbi:NAD-dependent histone deacetylase HST3 KNAG_0B03220 [Huiozyma naganishii CBS 8797]|uniref:Deacetylase sirtuin-type domain-containing protein n=1 Tax=Huiozyma naganishii (strain ATCC MYA-139 / BCRC 22969 / CBS 8797 / KCTC 17520 / NBRC 10181 / NCYC 3082 / Yp74L-3) TaxID=1071383 RepID=J7RGU7_HUIN7|nr:hypothetical protein KNAG_0B03220 [Kazachstania naganishii CBS 8797]CCK68763.1 hypothetical protein KNAG_0B03220 [Kazachstania naganishii CBS 8797]
MTTSIQLLTGDQRSSSFDETDLTINQVRRVTVENGRIPCKLVRAQSVVGAKPRRKREDFITEKLIHISELDEDNVLLQNINKSLSRSKRIIVLTGAGISCNAGIPDFRSANGLYKQVKSEYPKINISSGQEMFDISLFRDEMKISVWATFMEKLYSSVQTARPTKTHRFIAHLKNRNKMLRCYTQNIDGLENNLGLELSSKGQTKTYLNELETNSLHNIHQQLQEKEQEKKEGFNATWKNFDVVQLHGDLNTLNCTKCFHIVQWSRSYARSFRRGELPSCPNCAEINMKRSQQGKRVVDTVGLLRPNIVLYGENHPSGEIISQGLNFDICKGKPDFFIIMGTSLKVDGVKKLVKQISKQVHEKGGLVVLVNKTSIGDSSWHGIIDYQIWEDCDSWVDFLEDEIPDFFKAQRQVERQRQLKREASELRKSKAEETKRTKESESFNTPPTTPVREELMLEEKDGGEKDMKGGVLNDIKRKLIATGDDFRECKRAKNISTL